MVESIRELQEKAFSRGGLKHRRNAGKNRKQRESRKVETALKNLQRDAKELYL